jgi:tape measure domain-containing protein
MAVENVKIVYTIEDGELDALIAKFGKLTKEEQEQVRLMQQIDRQTTQTVGNQNQGIESVTTNVKRQKNEYEGLNKTIGNIRNTIVTAFVVDKLIAFGNEAIATTKRMEALNNAIKFASGSQLEYQRNTSFLAETSKVLGINLETATSGFKTILASAKPAGIESQKTREIFEGIATAVTAMGLSTEDSNGTFLALGQMLSKGTVQAEELRGQIGERIPGAFNLAAQALGVTTRELNKMLEQGQVLSNDFVPKFANKLKEQFSPALKDSANSLNAVSARAENAYNSLKLAFGQVGQDAYKGTLVVITNILEGLAKFVSGNQNVKTSTEQSIDALKNERTELNNLVKSIRDKNIGNETRLALVEQLNQKFPEFAKTVDVVNASEKELEKALKAVNNQFELQIFNVAKQGLLKEYQKNTKDITDEQMRLLESLRKAESGQEGFEKSQIESAIQRNENRKKIFKDGLDADLDSLKKQLQLLGLTEKEANDLANKSSAEKISIDKKAQEELAKQQAQFALRELEAQQKLAQDKIKNQIELNNLILANESTTNTEKIEVIRANQNLEVELLALQNAQKKTQYEIDKNNAIQVRKLTQTEVLAIDTETAQQQKVLAEKIFNELDAIQMKDIEDGISRGKKRQEEILEIEQEIAKEQLKITEDLIDKQIKAYEKQQEKEKQIKEKAVELGTAIANFAFQQTQNDLEKEVENLQSQKEYELSLAQGNKSKELEINQRFAEKEREIKQKQAQSDKDKAVFDILTSTSVGIVKALATANIPLSVLIGSLGLIQLLSVTSRPIPKFRKGTDYLDLPKNGTDADGMIIEAHKGERILPTHLNEQIKNVPNFQIPELVLKGLQNTSAENGYYPTKQDFKDAVKEGLKQIPLHSIRLDENGFEKWVTQTNSETKIFNKNITW